MPGISVGTFAFRDEDYDGTWEARKLFEIPNSITVDAEVITLGKKFLRAPDMSREVFGVFVFIGTGHCGAQGRRENPGRCWGWRPGYSTFSI